MQQPQYYKTVRASERLPEKDQEVFIIGYLRSDKGFIRREWCNLQNSWFIRVYTKGLDESGKDDLLTSFREGHKSINSIAWLEPIPIPDAERLREALEKIVATLDPAIRIELSHHDMMVSIHNIAREALSNTSDGWVRVEQKLPDSTEERKIPVQQFMKDGTQTIGRYHYKNWINKGVTHWRPLPLPPQPINP